MNPRGKQLWSVNLAPLFAVMQNAQVLAGVSEVGGGASKKDKTGGSATPFVLEELDISCNGLLDSHMQQFQSALRGNTSLRSGIDAQSYRLACLFGGGAEPEEAGQSQS